MPRKRTAEIANADILNGEKLYLEKARKTLPYLVRQAKAGQPIYYSNLAEEVKISNPRNLNYVLGAIGNALIALAKQTNEEIPPIQCLVINKKEGLPGEGIGWFITPLRFNGLNRSQKHRIVDAQLSKIYTYPYWDWVLKELNLEPVKTDLKKDLAQAKKYKDGGESVHHKRFKNFIAKNPSALGLNKRISNGQIEYTLPSADTIDILFTDKDLKIGVEVKSIISDTPDLLRGLFQCVKYKHLIEAEQTIGNNIPNSRVILALQGELPEELVIVKNLLGIEVIESIQIKP